VAGALDISVVIPAHDRPLRLLWLLNALEVQTLDPARWEVVVAHDCKPPTAQRLLAEHPLTLRGTLREIERTPGTGPAPALRNDGWRAARGTLIAFTDDDCRPDPGWLAALAAAAAASPGEVLQGSVRSDPNEAEVLARVPWARTLEFDPPNWHAQTANIAFPRELLERLEGFDEAIRGPGGEDTDLWARAEDAGAQLVAVPEARVYHAVHPMTLAQYLRSLSRWADIPAVVKRHPRLRARLPYRGLFWKERHARLLLGAAGAVAARRSPVFWALALPWVLAAWPGSGRTPRGVVRAVAKLPPRAAEDVGEIAAMVRGSVRHRTFFL
jgi:glycosyltransferase involved in cell wall biosynthesis